MNETPAETLARLNEIRARDEARTAGEWKWDRSRSGSIGECSHLGDTLIALDDTYENYEADCEFLEGATIDIPALLALVEWQRGEIEKRNKLLREAKPAGFLDSHDYECDAWAEKPCTCGLDAMTHAERLRYIAGMRERFSDTTEPMFVGEERDALLAGAKALERKQWMPIEEAPKGEWIIFYRQRDGWMCTCLITEEGGFDVGEGVIDPDDKYWHPTHFMPLPAPPTKGGMSDE